LTANEDQEITQNRSFD